ncbi:hypothetical protein OAE20_03080 [Porticoccaceae bacterium]|nr:hypothetical protein [Porticoccaceae bacterium]
MSVVWSLAGLRILFFGEKVMYLDIKFKGDRNYAQGGDLFELSQHSLIKFFGGGYLRKIAFKSFSKKHCLIILEVRPDKGNHIIGGGIFSNKDGVDVKFWLVEGHSDICERYPFDEDELVELSTIEGSKIFLSIQNKFSLIEHIVALTKKLNYHLTPDVKGKWVFGQLDLLDKLPVEYETVMIERISERKKMFSLNKIIVDEIEMGEIRFIVGAP